MRPITGRFSAPFDTVSILLPNGIRRRETAQMVSNTDRHQITRRPFSLHMFKSIHSLASLNLAALRMDPTNGRHLTTSYLLNTANRESMGLILSRHSSKTER